jgi:hypothetical protein
MSKDESLALEGESLAPKGESSALEVESLALKGESSGLERQVNEAYRALRTPTRART